MLSGSEERALGLITSVRLGFTDYDLVFTNLRIVAAKVGRSGLAQVFGGLAGAAISIDAHSKHREKFAGLDLESLLAADKKNFEIPYGRIESAKFTEGASGLVIRP